MKCFYNPAQDALGACKSCGRGLSAEFITEFPKGLACKNRCEADVQAVISLIDNNIAITPASTSLVKGVSSTYYASTLLYIIMAVIFCWMGKQHDETSPIFYMGIAFGAFALYNLLRAFKASSSLRKS